MTNKRKTVLPPKLRMGDTIGIVAPSKPIEDINTDEQIKSGIAFIERMGFKVAIAKNVASNDPKEKADDVNSMFGDKTVKAVMFAKGGDVAQTLLPFLDWEKIDANPKILCGYSDATVLLVALNKKLGLVTFHSNDLNSFGRQQTPYDSDEFIRMMVNGAKGDLTANSERQTVRGGSATGKIMGGNLRCLLKLRDTEYWPDFDDAILFLESYKGNDTRMDLFNALEDLGVFEKVKGVMIGYNYGMQVITPESKQMENIILDMTSKHDFPILKVNDFGHMCSQTVIPIGVKAEIDADKKSIKIIEDFVK